MRRSSLLPILAILAISLGARAAGAVAIAVNDLGDAFHGPPSGCAVTGTGTCTLRDAIHFSNVTPGRDSIGFTTGGTIAVGPGGLPAITDEVGLGGNFFSLVKIDGSAASGADGLTVAANDSTVASLWITGFGGAGIRVTGDGNTVGNGLCWHVCPPWLRVFGNDGHGIVIEGSNNRLGFSTIEANGGDGVRLRAGASGNEIGWAYGNLIKDNGGAGLRVGESDADTATTGNRISLLTIRDSGGLAVDVGDEGVSPNDVLDADTGPGGLQNFPVLTSAVSGPGAVVVSGTLNSTPNTTFDLAFFYNAVADPSGHGEAEASLGQLQVTTDAQGDAAFTEPFARLLAEGTSISALAARDDTGDFSELGAAVATTLPPPMQFYTVTPCRVMDTRWAPGPWGGPAMRNGEDREIQFAGQCGIPSDAQAVSVNVTAYSQSHGSVALFPAHSVSTYMPTVHFKDGTARANNSRMALVLGDLRVSARVETNPGTVDVMIDVNGYFR